MSNALAGAVNAFLGGKDYSNGAIGWDGNDFGMEKWPAYKLRYLKGYEFTDSKHGEMFGLKSLEKPGEKGGVKYKYMYQSTAAFEGISQGAKRRTIFYRPSDDYIKAIQGTFAKDKNGNYKYKPYGGIAS
jgi:hypothetical protein